MKVLIVEDERALADALEHIVRRAGYAADAVYNGTDALAQAMTFCCRIWTDFRS